MADVETPTTQAQESKNETTENKEEAGKTQTVTKESVEAFNLLAQGKRNLLCGEVTDAVSQLQEACRLLASKYGDTADECAEAYLCYGTSLLELSRMESGVLGNALDGIDEEEEDKDSSSDGKVEDADKVSDSSEDKEGDTEEEGTEPESEDIGDEEGEGEAEGEVAADGEAKEGGSKDGEKKENEADDDVSNLQLSWEMLELAKLIYSRQTTKEMKLKAADAHLRLGEVGLETEQYEQAIEDFLSCLSLQKEYLEPESRLIAETHYQIGVACCHAGRYDESISNLKSAVSVIRAKIASLEKFVEEEEAKIGKGKEPASFDDPLTKARKEIKDLNEILPDILTKIEDTEDEHKSQDKVKQLVKDNLATDFGAPSGFSGDAKPKAGGSSVNEITHLVRKKRKPEEENSTEESKKPRQEEAAKSETNGEKPQKS